MPAFDDEKPISAPELLEPALKADAAAQPLNEVNKGVEGNHIARRDEDEENPDE